MRGLRYFMAMLACRRFGMVANHDTILVHLVRYPVWSFQVKAISKLRFNELGEEVQNVAADQDTLCETDAGHNEVHVRTL